MKIFFYGLLIYSSLSIICEGADSFWRCFDDACVPENDDVLLPILESTGSEFGLRMTCSEPFAACDVAKLAFEYCIQLSQVVQIRDECAVNAWRLFSLKTHLALLSNFDAVVNMMGFQRTNNWFEVNTLYLHKIIADHILVPMGIHFILARPLHILEIGSYEGGSSIWFARNLLSHPGSTLTCIDPWSSEIRDGINAADVWDRFNANIAATGFSDKIRIIRSDSLPALVSLIANMHSQKTQEQHQQPLYDFIYIDGSHAVTDVLTDILLSWQLLRVGGLLVLDDVAWNADNDSKMELDVNIDMHTTVSDPAFGFCATIGNKTKYSLKESIIGLLTNLPCEVLRCGYQVAVKKLQVSTSYVEATHKVIA